MAECPCCGAPHVFTRPERTQSNGLVLGAGRCLQCHFSWTTINGQLSRNSAKAIDSHRRSWTGSAGR